MADWQPTATPAALRARASLLAQIRSFFASAGVLEVATPVLARHGVSEVHIDSIAVPGHGFLQSSPEYHMKRLLAAGSGPIYQISPAFREGEAGERHNREFTLLEWYRPGFTLPRLIDECLALLQPILEPAAVEHWRFRQLFRQHTGLDPLTAPIEALTACTRATELPPLDRAALVDWLMATVVEPALPKTALTVVRDFPGWAAALARRHQDSDGEWLAARFELYCGGLELANGYHELNDAAEQAARFAADNQHRARLHKPVMEADPALLAALHHGLPDCAGVAIGLERLLMVQLGASDIAEVLSFPAARA